MRVIDYRLDFINEGAQWKLVTVSQKKEKKKKNGLCKLFELSAGKQLLIRK